MTMAGVIVFIIALVMKYDFEFDMGNYFNGKPDHNLVHFNYNY